MRADDRRYAWFGAVRNGYNLHGVHEFNRLMDAQGNITALSARDWRRPQLTAGASSTSMAATTRALERRGLKHPFTQHAHMQRPVDNIASGALLSLV